MTASDPRVGEIQADAIEAAAKAFIEYGTILPAIKAAAPYIAAKALEDAADAALDRTVGMDSHIAREADDRGYMQRHNVRAASNWLRARAAAVRGES